MSDTTDAAGISEQADHSRIVEATLRRLNQPTQHSEEELAELRYGQERPVRQKFRRLADPGIIRDNNDADAKRVLLKISQNLLSDPENPKFREFKSTNATIQRSLINPKGAIEYAIEMGFRATVEDFQPKYVWHSTPENLVSLRIGSEIVKEHVDLAVSKEERSTKSKQTVAEEKAAAALLAFEDDRKTRRQLDARVKEYPPMSPMRAAPQKAPASPVFKTQGAGETLAGPVPRQGFTQEDENMTVDEDKDE